MPNLFKVSTLKVASLGLLLMLLQACVSAPLMNRPEQAAHSAKCQALMSRLEYQVHKANVRDAQYALVEGFPLYRVNRLLENLVDEAVTEAQRLTWLQQAAHNGVSSYLIEVANLPVARQQTLPNSERLAAELQDCAWQQSTLLAEDSAWKRFAEKVRVPSEYYAGRKLLGLYPITNLAMKSGIADWQADTRALFNMPINDKHRYLRWQPAVAGKSELGPVTRNALGMPELTPEQWRTLADQYAPTWMIEQGGPFDALGSPKPAGEFHAEPIVYWQPSIAKVKGRLLPQISYVAWFAERPKEGFLDILGGKLDGVVWRVTLAPEDGAQGWQPLIYDSIHPCGCYHLFFPTTQFQHCAEDSSRENAFVPQAAPSGDFALWIQSGSHYIRRLMPAEVTQQTKHYRLKPLDDLRLAEQSKQRLFGSNGLVAGTERLERVLLWTSGLESPGGMRQWGSHATAFSGERYFDEPGLFDKEFCSVEADTQ